MATISITSNLQVLNKYKSLVKESIGKDSIYIRAKETIQELARDGDLNDVDKGKLISEVIGNLSSSLAQACLSAALSWADKEKEIELKKLSLSKELDSLQEDVNIKQNQAQKLLHESVAVQANTIKTYGTPLVTDGTVTGFSGSGKIDKEITILEKEAIISDKKISLTDSKIKSEQAATHKIVADTYWNYGSVTYNLNDSGLSNVTETYSSTAFVPLAKVQRAIAEEQAKGYAYNAWANASTAASSMLGTALASQMASDSTITTLATQIQTINNKLSAVAPPAF